MTSRLLSTSVAVAVVLGLAVSATAQNNKTEPAKSQANEKTTEPAKTPEAAKPETTKPAAVKPKASTKPKYEKATFGAGCFWHVEAEFDRLPGVQSAVSGYSGGDPRFRSYDVVHEGWTGHAEVVQVTYDPEIITYEDLLKVFWSCHDPTTLNRQGLDEGTQYRSVIFYHNKEQREAALKSYQYLSGAAVFRDPIVTQLLPMKGFFRAEPEHQDFYGGKPRATSRRSKAAVKKAARPQTKAKSSSPTAEPADSTATGPLVKPSN